MAGVREIRNRLSEYLCMAANGERVAVTRRGQVVAELGPPAYVMEDDAHAELRRRARTGTIRPGAPNRPEVYPHSARRLPTIVVQDLLDDVRGDR